MVAGIDSIVNAQNRESSNEPCCHKHQHSYHNSSTQTSRVDLSNAGITYKVSNHDEAVVVSCILGIRNKSYALEDLVSSLEAIAREIEDDGGIIGHIKAAIAEGDNSAHISITAGDCKSTVLTMGLEELSQDALISVVFITYLIDSSVITNIILAEMGKMFE